MNEREWSNPLDLIDELTILHARHATLVLRDRYPHQARLIKASQKMYGALNQLLLAPDLNLDELEPATVQAIEDARAAVAIVEDRVA